MKTLLIDLDEVCCDLVGPWTDWVNEQCWPHVKREDITNWDWRKCFPDCEVDFYDYLKKPGVFRNLRPIPGALSTLAYFKDYGYTENVIVTSRPAMHHNDTLDWIGQFLPGCIDDVIFCNNKRRVIGDMIIDDKPQTILECQDLMYAVIMDQPYNYDVRAVRAYDWVDIWTFVEEFVHAGR